MANFNYYSIIVDVKHAWSKSLLFIYKSRLIVYHSHIKVKQLAYFKKWTLHKEIRQIQWLYLNGNSAINICCCLYQLLFIPLMFLLTTLIDTLVNWKKAVVVFLIMSQIWNPVDVPLVNSWTLMLRFLVTD